MPANEIRFIFKLKYQSSAISGIKSSVCDLLCDVKNYT